MLRFSHTAATVTKNWHAPKDQVLGSETDTGRRMQQQGLLKKIFNNTSTKTALTETLMLLAAETNTARRMQQQGLLQKEKLQ